MEGIKTAPLRCDICGTEVTHELVHEDSNAVLAKCRGCHVVKLVDRETWDKAFREYTLSAFL